MGTLFCGVGGRVGADFDDQQHFAYVDANGRIWDSWYDAPSNSWNREQVNLGVATTGPAAAGDPFLWVWAGSDGNQQLHITYVDAVGQIWDAFWDLPPGQPGGRAGP